jgi:ribose 5-phosphate isomerase B
MVTSGGQTCAVFAKVGAGGPHLAAGAAYTCGARERIGVWRSLVARPLWERKAVGSNPATPTCFAWPRARARSASATLATMRVYLGSDHAGYELKVHLVSHLTGLGYEITDVGPAAFDPEDDYPAYCIATAAKVMADPGSLGVVIGGSGNGEQISANKVEGVRAALAWSTETAQLSRQHNDANVVAIGAREHTIGEATEIVEVFLTTPFSGNPRHQRRIDQIAGYEKTREVPDLPAR